MSDVYEAERAFFDGLYQLWSKTTGTEDSYWSYEEDTGFYDSGPGTYNVWSVDSSGQKKLVASVSEDEDADFITGVHAAFGDIIRRVQEAFDEADHKDYDRDSRECEIARLELEKDRLEALLDKNGVPY